MKKIKFALKMKDGVEARTLEELQEAFDLGLAMGYLADGRLERWLEDRLYEEEAGQIAGLDKEAPDLGKRLCTILQVPYTEEMEMDAVIAKLLEDDRALQELAVGFSASVSGRGPGSVQQIDGEGARQVLDDIDRALTDASARARFQEHVFQWMRENLEGVCRNPSKYLMDELCRRLALMVRDRLSKLQSDHRVRHEKVASPSPTKAIDLRDRWPMVRRIINNRKKSGSYAALFGVASDTYAKQELVNGAAPLYIQAMCSAGTSPRVPLGDLKALKTRMVAAGETAAIRDVRRWLVDTMVSEFAIDIRESGKLDILIAQDIYEAVMRMLDRAIKSSIGVSNGCAEIAHPTPSTDGYRPPSFDDRLNAIARMCSGGGRILMEAAHGRL